MVFVRTHKIRSMTFAFAGVLLFVLLSCPGTLAQSRLPDLVVSSAEIKRDGTGQMAASLTVTVSNRCSGTAGPSYVLATFKQGPTRDAKPIYFVGHAVKVLRGGKSVSNIFDLKGKNIPYGTFVLIEADPYKKVRETDKDNNWRTLFPDGAAANQEQCSAKQ